MPRKLAVRARTRDTGAASQKLRLRRRATEPGLAPDADSREAKALDRELTRLLERFDARAERIQFSRPRELCEAKIGSLAYPGIYKIDIRTPDHCLTLEQWKAWLEKRWGDTRFRKEFVPNLSPGHLKKHTRLTPWMPFYVGKSKSITRRLDQHLNLDLKAETFALKIRARDNLRGVRFRVSTVRISESNYDVFAPRLERLMRHRVRPVVGRP